MKKHFEEPQMEVVRFDAKDAFIATSGCIDSPCPSYNTIPVGPPIGGGCTGPGDAMIIG